MTLTNIHQGSMEMSHFSTLACFGYSLFFALLVAWGLDSGAQTGVQSQPHWIGLTSAAVGYGSYGMFLIGAFSSGTQMRLALGRRQRGLNTTDTRDICH